MMQKCSMFEEKKVFRGIHFCDFKQFSTFNGVL